MLLLPPPAGELLPHEPELVLFEAELRRPYERGHRGRGHHRLAEYAAVAWHWMLMLLVLPLVAGGGGGAEEAEGEDEILAGVV